MCFIRLLLAKTGRQSFDGNEIEAYHLTIRLCNNTHSMYVIEDANTTHTYGKYWSKYRMWSEIGSVWFSFWPIWLRVRFIGKCWCTKMYFVKCTYQNGSSMWIKTKTINENDKCRKNWAEVSIKRVDLRPYVTIRFMSKITWKLKEKDPAAASSHADFILISRISGSGGYHSEVLLVLEVDLPKMVADIMFWSRI